ncbi:hypothetical protein VaNZ11_008264 [Volvox africanus]|uniref:Auxin efflux carrier n=1 Tax=Volvox africanus TaxID=51714 RepID=A0ABQ5S4P7_9CHLO|nr:hypothetical protein VaNZ11_008264 [Volvox africanus]
MAWLLQPVVTVGLQILLSIFLGWLLVRLRILDAEKYMPQVNTLVLWVGVTCLSGYYLGLKLQLEDAAAWRSLAAYILWIAVIKVGILTYCLLVRRSHRRRANRSCRVSDKGNNDGGNGDDVSGANAEDGNGGGDGGSRGGNRGSGGDNGSSDGGGFSVLREFALLTLVLTANNCGMIGLPIMDATFGPPGRRLALLTGIPVMLWVVPFAIFAFEMHNVREDALKRQRQQRSRSSNNMSCGDSTTANAYAVDSRWGSDQNTVTVTDSAKSSEAMSLKDAAKRRRSLERTSTGGGNVTPTRIPGQSTTPFSPELPSQPHRAPPGCNGRQARQRSRSSPGDVSENGLGALGGSAGDRRLDSSGRAGGTRHGERAMGQGGQCIGVPDDLALPGPMLVDTAKAAVGAVKAAAAAVSSPLPPLISPRISPFSAIGGDYMGGALAAGGVSNEVFDGNTIRPVAATASPVQQVTSRRSSSLNTYRAAAAPQLLSTVPSGDLEDVLPSRLKPTSPEASTVLPAVPLPAALSLVSMFSGALYGSEQCLADGSTEQTGRVAESPTARHRIAPQPRKSFSGVAAALAGGAARGIIAAPSSPVASARLETRPSSASLSAVDLPIPHRWLLGEEEAGLPVAGRQSQGGAAGSDGDDTGGVTAEPAAPVVNETANIVFRQLRAVIWTVGKNPLLWSLLLALITNLSGLRKFLDPDSPSFVQALEFIPGLLHWFASIAIPVSLVSIGVWMYGKRMRASLLKQAGTLLLLKVLVLPLLQAACAVAVGLPPEPTMTLVLLALCPTATTSFVIAAHFGYGADVVSAVTLGGTILLIPTILVALQLPRGMGIAVHLTVSPAPAAAGGE